VTYIHITFNVLKIQQHQLTWHPERNKVWSKIKSRNQCLNMKNSFSKATQKDFTSGEKMFRAKLIFLQYMSSWFPDWPQTWVTLCSQT